MDVRRGGRPAHHLAGHRHLYPGRHPARGELIGGRNMRMETLYHPVASELDIMRAEQGGSDGRTVFGILVPWNHRQRIDENLVEMFERGSADHVITAGERGRAPGGLPAYRMHFAREHVRQ